MKKLSLLGVIALGSMSFVATDCWAEADAAVKWVEENAIYASPSGLENVWHYTFEACANRGGQETVIITVSK